jgi:hypothetical protein
MIPESRQKRVVEAIKKRIRSQPHLVAEHLGIPSGVEKVSSQREREIYWTPDPEVLRDHARFQDEAAAAAMTTAQEGEPYETTVERASALFAHRLYPARLNLIRSGPRSLSVTEQMKFSDDMERLGPPEPEDNDA